MAISIYDISIPVLTRGLTNLSSILDKAAAHAAARKIDPAVLAQARLFPDMYPAQPPGADRLRHRQGRRGPAGRHRIPKHEDTETTLPELKRASPRRWTS